MARLLLVDDDPDFLRWEAAVLSADGHEVLIATTGAEALRAVEEARPDLVLLDILMPDIDGRLLHEQICQKADIPVVFVSVIRQAGESVLRGASGYITKPLDPVRLVSAVEGALGPTTTDPGVILVVDDDADIRSLFRTVLTTSGYKVDLAPHGAAALERLAREPRVGLVITDVHMLPVNGIQLVRAMREDPRFEQVPVIVQTSDDMVARDNCWVELGVERIMVKDKFLRWLRDTVRRRVG
jgi:CheY-like chemotaxis protein